MTTLLTPLLLAGCSALAALAGPTGSCQGPHAYVVGTTVTGTLGQNECSGPGDISGHLYTIALSGETGFELTMSPSGFDGAMAMYTSTNQLIYENTSTLKTQLFLPAGQYTLAVGRKYPSGGSYTLTSPPVAQHHGCSVNAFTLSGARIAGSVTNADCPGIGGSFGVYYFVPLLAGQSVNVSTTMDQDGGFVAWAQDSPNTQLLQKSVPKDAPTTFSYTAVAAGVYRVHAIWGGAGVLPIGYPIAIN